MTGSRHDLVQADTYTLPCRGCRRPITVAASAHSYDCTACGASSFIFRCDRCDGANLTGGKSRRAPVGWTCNWCLTQNMNQGMRRLRGKGAGTAAQAWDALNQHGLTHGDPDARVLGGFTLLGGSGDIPPPGTLCSIGGLADGVLIVAELGATGSLLIPYHELMQIEIGGKGTLNTGPAFIGGGSGVIGSLRGMATATMLTNLMSNTIVDSYARLTTPRTELLLAHCKHPPQAVRNALSVIFVRRLAATRVSSQPVTPVTVEQPPASPVDELERLTRLHAAGTLTDSEFEAARARQILRLHQPTPE